MINPKAEKFKLFFHRSIDLLRIGFKEEQHQRKTITRLVSGIAEVAREIEVKSGKDPAIYPEIQKLRGLLVEPQNG
ncbi:MAG: hypothetical protein RIA64_07510 [Rhodospirillales bacterium]